MIRLIILLCSLPVSLSAEVPRVMTDIAPVHSLTAQVMGTLGRPDLLLPADADPHDFALRPSDAARLSNADLVIWTGSGLTPWLADPLAALAPNAPHISLLDSDGWEKLEIRTDHAEHDHGDFDPHGWLDPATARVWLNVIAETLAEADPANAATYHANATAAVQALSALQDEIADQLAPMAEARYLLPHDAYQYFEHRFGLTAAGTISDVAGRTPGPAQVAALRDRVATDQIACVFSDIEIGDRWVALVSEGNLVRTARLNATGAGLTPGPDLYDTLLRNMAAAFDSCLTAP